MSSAAPGSIGLLGRAVGYVRQYGRPRTCSSVSGFLAGMVKAACWGLAYAVVVSVAWSIAESHYGGVPMTVAPVVVQQTQADIDRQFAAQVASFNLAHRCASVADWKRAHPGRMPTRMVQHADRSERLEIVRWTYPAAPGEWVDGFCGTG
jgi:hypothetical protein